MHQLKYMGSYELIKYPYYTLREKGWDAHKFFGFTDKKSWSASPSNSSS